jgi:hypothetical protein
MLALKNHITPSLFTQRLDIYSYGMTCYEILTSCISFENLSSNNYDVVLGSARPKLSNHLRSWMCILLERCWHLDPLERRNVSYIRRNWKEG